MSIEKVIEEEAIEKAKAVAKVFNIVDFKITVEVYNVREGEFKVKFNSSSSGKQMAKSNVINAAAIAGIEEECRWNNVTCDFSISVTVA
jgi:hypothetical protein